MDVADLVPAGARTAAVKPAVRFVRSPLIHFLVLGSMLAIIRAAFPVVAADDVRVIQVTPAVTARLETLAAAPAGAGVPLLDRWIDDEVLYREGVRLGMAWNPSSIARLQQVGNFVGEHDGAEALADVARLGLERDDPVVRAQVIGRMRLRLLDVDRDVETNDDELERHLVSQRASFARPALVSFSHVFVKRDRQTPADTLRAIRERIAGEPIPASEAAKLGDAFQPGTSFVAYTRDQVAAVFGADVAAAVMAEPVTAWSAPLRSAYGWHLVRVDARTDEFVPDLDAIREQVKRSWQAEQAERSAAIRLQEMRRSYRVEIDPSIEALLPRSQTAGG